VVVKTLPNQDVTSGTTRITNPIPQIGTSGNTCLVRRKCRAAKKATVASVNATHNGFREVT